MNNNFLSCLALMASVLALAACSNKYEHFAEAAEAWEMKCSPYESVRLMMEELDERLEIDDFRYSVNSSTKRLATAHFFTTDAMVLLTVTGSEVTVTIHNDSRVLEKDGRVSSATLEEASLLLMELNSMGCRSSSEAA